ncbi:hypothetical protein D9M71_601820 [compost metagenome]
MDQRVELFRRHQFFQIGQHLNALDRAQIGLVALGVRLHESIPERVLAIDRHTVNHQLQAAQVVVLFKRRDAGMEGATDKLVEVLLDDLQLR